MEDRSCDRRLLKLRLKIRSTSAEPQYGATHVVLVILFWCASTPRISLDRSTRPQDYLFSSKTEIQGTSPKNPQRLLHPNPQPCSSTKIPQQQVLFIPLSPVTNLTNAAHPPYNRQLQHQTRQRLRLPHQRLPRDPRPSPRPANPRTQNRASTSTAQASNVEFAS